MYIRKEDVEINEASCVYGGEGSIFSRDIWPRDLFPKNAGKFLRYVTIPPGSTLGKHVHNGESELFFVLSGSIEAQDGDETVTLRQGDVLLTGKGNSHALKNIGSEPFVMVSVILYEKE